MEIQHNIGLAPYTTFGIGGPARYFCTISSEHDIPAALHYAKKYDLETFVLGGGSNLLISDEYYEGLVMHMAIKGVTSRQHGDKVLYDAGAGESWDRLVSLAVAGRCAGIECLAGIPGTVGGTPVQNVGAYGQEVSETIASVRVYDTESESFTELSPGQCGFHYRQSIFNTTEVGRYIVTHVRFALTKDGAPKIAYAELQKHFAADPNPSLTEVADAVRGIRRAKGMLIVEGDPDCRGAGSFFKNPVVDEAVIPRIAQVLNIDAEKIPRYPTTPGHVKIPAAWLLEQAGFHKGFTMGPAGISSRHTLALINRGDAVATDIMALRNLIQNTVEARFGIRLQQEPVSLGR
ncbi:MAG TPA: UDP-N-acetylmuramate dehydrogenase [Acidobacteriaceae bacterium]|nr:UDP-N-acetylmuramate dehydrogenase [Acidobacteriaceae bacterium]